MEIKKISFSGFRNLFDFEFCPHNNINVICGANAQGKTNIIEGIWLFTGAKSFRGAKDIEMVGFGKEKAHLKMNFLSGEIERTAEINIINKRTAIFDEKPLKSPSLLAGNFCAIVFSPEDLSLVKDGPSARRKFLDIAIGQLYPSYINNLKCYSRALAQRNKIIKDYKIIPNGTELLDIFEEEICENGKKIISLRKEYLKKTQPFISEIYSGISKEREDLEFTYINSSEEENLREALYEARKTDVFSGITSVGPHRDDIDFKINGIYARKFGSQGQQRSVALSLKLAEAKTLKEITGEEPVVILDDVMSELDPKRQDYILNHIKERQVFITCCDPSNIKGIKEGKVFNIESGRIKQEI